MMFPALQGLQGLAINSFSPEMANPQIHELSDPAWRRWFDILKEQGVDRLADSSVGVHKGMWSMPYSNVGPMQGGPFGAGTQLRSSSNTLMTGTDDMRELQRQKGQRGGLGSIYGKNMPLQEDMRVQGGPFAAGPAPVHPEMDRSPAVRGLKKAGRR
jgi:hypothetical protein